MRHSVQGREDAASAEAFRRLFDRYYRSVFYLFANRGFTDEECRDLTQETFLRVSKGMEGLRSDGSSEAWLRRIAVNVWKNELRRRGADKRAAREVSLDAGRGGGPEPAEGGGFAVASPAAGPLEELLAREELDRLERSLRSLPPQMRRCFLLCIDQGLKYREVAAVMKLSIQTVKSHIHQARQRLRAAIDTGPGRLP